MESKAGRSTIKRTFEAKQKSSWLDLTQRSSLIHRRKLRRLLPITCRYACENAGKLAWLHRAGEASAGVRGARLSLRNSNFKQQIRLHDLAARFARGLPEFSLTL
jgi:hypothetical protein